MNGLWQDFLSLFWVRPCPLCQRSSRSSSSGLCPPCEAQILQCQLSGQAAHREWEADLPLWCWGRYQDSLKRTIAALKYQNQPHLAVPLGRWMATAWNETRHQRSPQLPRLTIVPIPLHASKLKQRGFNQAALLAHSFGRYAQLPVLEQGLVRIKATEAQFGLSKIDRAENLTHAFELGKPLQALKRSQRKPSILLLDDIFTTGATARTAAQLLAAANISCYGIVALARAGES